MVRDKTGGAEKVVDAKWDIIFCYIYTHTTKLGLHLSYLVHLNCFLNVFNKTLSVLAKIDILMIFSPYFQTKKTFPNSLPVSTLFTEMLNLLMNL